MRLEKHIPYAMNTHAAKLMHGIKHISRHPDREREILYLLNAAEGCGWMSHYQLSESHVTLGNLYYDDEIYGSALEHYVIALSMNDKAPVKRKIAELKKLSNLKYSLDANLIGEPDLSFLAPPMRPTAKIYQFPVPGKAYRDPEDDVYDPAWEEEVANRLSKLPEEYQKSFYELREQTAGDSLGTKRLDSLRLQAMQRSYAYQLEKEGRLLDDDDIQIEERAMDLIEKKKLFSEIWDD